MMRCWCRSAMAVWLDSTLAHASECERGGADCADRVETIALRLNASHAHRIGDTLHLATDAGERRFTDSPHHGSDGVQHRYLGRLGSGSYHLMWRRYAYGDRFVLVSDRSADETVLDALPQPSPSGRHMVVISRGHPASGTRSVTVLSVEPHRLTPEYRFEPGHSVLYRFVQWESEEAVRLEIGSPATRTDHRPVRHEMLARRHGCWQFGPVAEAAVPQPRI